MHSRSLRILLVGSALGLAAAAPASAAPMVGPSVGSVDLLISQGNKAYNDGKFADARDLFLKAARANPGNPPIYLSLARAHLQNKEIAQSCFSYRVYLKAAPQAPDREKAQSELEACDRQRTALVPPPPDLSPGFVSQKAAFQESVEANKLVGVGSAAEVLTKMLADGYVGPDLADMAQKLRQSVEKQAFEGYDRALRRETVDAVQLRESAQLFRLASDIGATDASYSHKARMVEGFADLQEKKYVEAEAAFGDAKGAGNDKDARFYAAVAIYRGGDKRRAVRQLETDLQDDPRTPLLRADQTIAQDPKAGAADLEKLLFKARFAGKN